MKNNSTVVSKSKNVILRKKKIKNGFSLYLDIHFAGKRYKEYLKLYISDNSRRSEEDRDNLKYAERIKARCILELQAKNHNDSSIIPKQTDFLFYMGNKIESRTEMSNSTRSHWKVVRDYIYNFSDGNLTFDAINYLWIEEFKGYLLKKVSHNSANIYYKVLKTVLNLAVKEEIIPRNPTFNVSNIKTTNPVPKFLTFDEVKLLNNAHCKNRDTKRSFLFCCFTGLRYSDVKKLKWKHIFKIEDKYYINFNQKKTSTEEYFRLSPQAIKFLEDFGEPEEKVFTMVANAWANKILKTWAKDAGLKKNLTFHMSRHTFATMHISNGTDLYVVSKLLGHSSIEQTQVYAQVINRKKDDAADRLPIL